MIELKELLLQFGIYRNTLPKEHNEFVRIQLQKKYETVTKTFTLQGRTYKGTFREDPMRKFNREAYAKESKLATVLASFGFDVILIEENSKEPGTKPDAIVNGIVMDFKETRRGNNGVALFFHENTGNFQLINMKKIRAAHFERPLSRRAPDVAIEPSDNSTIT